MACEWWQKTNIDQINHGCNEMEIDQNHESLVGMENSAKIDDPLEFYGKFRCGISKYMNIY